MPVAELVQFSLEDLDLFSAASGDCNPIHCSESYAAATTYGQRLAFGALGAIACLGKVALPENTGIQRIVADFQRPMFAGVDYSVRLASPEGHFSVRLFDGSVPVMALSVFPGNQSDSAPGSSSGGGNLPGCFEYSSAVERQEPDITPGLTLHGKHRCDSAALARLRERWAVTAPDIVVRTLLWASYFIGMELPGKYAVFFRFAATFSPQAYDPSVPLEYETVVKRIDPRLHQIRTDVRLLQNQQLLATGECLAFNRAPVLNPTREDAASYLQPSDDLAGKVALVIGASRGLGAATVHLLASQGARVIATARSSTKQTFSGSEGRIATAAGNAGDAAWMQQLLEQITADYGRLDFLVCNAFPPIVSLRMEPNGLARIQAYVQQAVGMVLTPLGCFLELLDQSAGCAVIVSSSAVRNPVREWPHYVAAKQAIEALAAVAPLQYNHVSTLVVRPAKLLTEMTNTPMGRKDAGSPGLMAARIVERLKRTPAPGASEILEGE
jgi:NAD(P)-dependent dehydrogenase (short-subunit alcohol dehydrogenase family)